MSTLLICADLLLNLVEQWSILVLASYIINITLIVGHKHQTSSVTFCGLESCTWMAVPVSNSINAFHLNIHVSWWLSIYEVIQIWGLSRPLSPM